MERIMYRKTLDVHKNGIQFLLQGFETADNLSRVIEISLMASGDAIDFPLENIEALMYVKTQSATEPSINSCTIRDNKVVYDVLPIVEEGITIMQLKIIETSVDGAKNVLASPKFAVEVTKSDADDGNAEQTTTFTALEDAIATAKAVYDERFLRMELSSDCMFRAYYADGTVYETDVLKRLFLNGNVLLSESFAHGGTGVRTGEDIDNSMYYSNVSKSVALNAKNTMEDSEKIWEEIKLHGVYTVFKVDFETGDVEYVSPSFKFNVNPDTGDLDAISYTYPFDDENDGLGKLVNEWLIHNGVVVTEIQKTIDTHTDEISELQNTDAQMNAQIVKLQIRVTPVELGGTGATTAEEGLSNLGGLPLAGGTMTGSLTLHEAPTNPLHASTKQYVDNNILHFKGTVIIDDGLKTFVYLPENIDTSKYGAFLATPSLGTSGNSVRFLPWDEDTDIYKEEAFVGLYASIGKEDRCLSLWVSKDTKKTVKFDLFLVPMAECITLTNETV